MSLHCSYVRQHMCIFFTMPTVPDLYSLSLHDALPISAVGGAIAVLVSDNHTRAFIDNGATVDARTEEHTSELQSQSKPVCRLLLIKKNTEQCVRFHTSLSTIKIIQASTVLDLTADDSN